MRRNLLVSLTLASVFVAALALAQLGGPGCAKGPLYHPTVPNGLDSVTVETTFHAQRTSILVLDTRIPVRADPAGEPGRPVHCGHLPQRPGWAPEWNRQKLGFESDQG